MTVEIFVTLKYDSVRETIYVFDRLEFSFQKLR